MKVFVNETQNFILKEFKLKSDYDKKLKLALRKIEEAADPAKQKSIKERNLFKFKSQAKLSGSKNLDKFVNRYDVHLENMITFDIETDKEFNVTENFLNFVNENLQVLYTRFVKLAMEREVKIQSRNKVGV